jgi:hypothetical protein
VFIAPVSAQAEAKACTPGVIEAKAGGVQCVSPDGDDGKKKKGKGKHKGKGHHKKGNKGKGKGGGVSFSIWSAGRSFTAHSKRGPGL